MKTRTEDETRTGLGRLAADFPFVPSHQGALEGDIFSEIVTDLPLHCPRRGCTGIVGEVEREDAPAEEDAPTPESYRCGKCGALMHFTASPSKQGGNRRQRRSLSKRAARRSVFAS